MKKKCVCKAEIVFSNNKCMMGIRFGNSYYDDNMPVLYSRLLVTWREGYVM